MKGIIFDLDQTLVNSDSLKIYRDNQEWKKVLEKIDQIQPFDGINDLLYSLNSHKVKLIIVTNSKYDYAKALLKKLNWNSYFIDIVTADEGYSVAFSGKKSKSGAFIIAQNLMNCRSDEVISISDDIEDVTASLSVGIFAFTPSWNKMILQHKNNISIEQLHVMFNPKKT
jgi:HAD superfamily hydrolase (TIGR01549 family)